MVLYFQNMNELKSDLTLITLIEYTIQMKSQIRTKCFFFNYEREII